MQGCDYAYQMYSLLYTCYIAYAMLRACLTSCCARSLGLKCTPSRFIAFGLPHSSYSIMLITVTAKCPDYVSPLLGQVVRDYAPQGTFCPVLRFLHHLLSMSRPNMLGEHGCTKNGWAAMKMACQSTAACTGISGK